MPESSIMMIALVFEDSLDEEVPIHEDVATSTLALTPR